jgi:SAM-dependent methyltransferase
MKKYKGISTLEILEGADNYNAWIAGSIAQYIKSPALEIGAGTGNISTYFKGFKSLVLTDSDPHLVHQLQKKFNDCKNISVEILDIEKKLGRVLSKFKTIYLVNVLEHIKDEKKAIENINRLLDQKGRIVVLVPAKKFAFTDLDVNLGHHKRYEKRELKELLEKAGFEVEMIEFFNFLGLLSWIVRDKVSKSHKSLKKSHVTLFDAIVPILSKIEPKKGLPFGISLIAVGKKTNVIQ